MNLKYARPPEILLARLALLLVMMACSQSPSGQNGPLPTDPGPPASATPPEESSPTAGEVVIETRDPCSLLTKEQVESAFGKSVQSFGPKPPGNVIGCKAEFADGNSFNINLFEREIDKQQFATQIIAYRKGCAEGLEAAF